MRRFNLTKLLLLALLPNLAWATEESSSAALGNLQVTFHVPVSISNFTPNTKVVVTCTFEIGDAIFTHGGGQKEISTDNAGNFEGVVDIQGFFGPSYEQKIRQVNLYTCKMRDVTGGRGYSGTNERSIMANTIPAPGKTRTLDVSGKIFEGLIPNSMLRNSDKQRIQMH